jgi:hypothetical protein
LCFCEVFAGYAFGICRGLEVEGDAPLAAG